MYRHFPSLAELVPPCARTVFDVIKPPTLAEVQPRFLDIDKSADRLVLIVRATLTCYEHGRGWLHAAYRERDFIPELHAALRLIEDSLRVLIQAAVGRRLTKTSSAVLFALCNFPLYKQLLDGGLEQRAVEEIVVRLVRDEASRANI